MEFFLSDIVHKNIKFMSNSPMMMQSVPYYSFSQTEDPLIVDVPIHLAAFPGYWCW